MNHKISIIICTKDRAESLQSTLESIKLAKVPADLPVELLVVDNGSADRTKRVVQAADLSTMEVRYISEPRIGKSHAYNTGISAAAGEILLCTDDDVRVPTHWIEGMCRPIFQGSADAVAGGVIFPPHMEDLLKTSPLKNRRGWVASTHEIDLRQPSRMVGANMAFHRRVLDKVSGFDSELGPGASGFGEDTLFSLQLLAAGYKLVGARDVVVEHYFDVRRISAEMVLDGARKMGRSHGFIFHHWEHKKSRLVVPRLILCYWHRYWMQWTDRNREVADQTISDQALRLEEDVAFYREYLVQSRRGFKYPLPRLALRTEKNRA